MERSFPPPGFPCPYHSASAPRWSSCHSEGGEQRGDANSPSSKLAKTGIRGHPNLPHTGTQRDSESRVQARTGSGDPVVHVGSGLRRRWPEVFRFTRRRGVGAKERNMNAYSVIITRSQSPRRRGSGCE